MEAVAAMAVSSDLVFDLPLDLGPWPSIPPPLAKQCALSCVHLPQFEQRMPSGFLSCLRIMSLDPSTWLQYSELGPDFPGFDVSIRWHSMTRQLIMRSRRVSGAAFTAA